MAAFVAFVRDSIIPTTRRGHAGHIPSTKLPARSPGFGDEQPDWQCACAVVIHALLYGMLSRFLYFEGYAGQRLGRYKTQCCNVRGAFNRLVFVSVVLFLLSAYFSVAASSPTPHSFGLSEHTSKTCSSHPDSSLPLSFAWLPLLLSRLHPSLSPSHTLLRRTLNSMHGDVG